MNNLSAEAWEERYQKGSDRWNLGFPAPPFVSLLNSPNAPQPGKLAVLGCGKGHDALLFANLGFEVLGFDFASSAVTEAIASSKIKGITAQFLQRDIFTLDREFSDSFDYVVEHTCFCAIDPSRRSQYVKTVKSILKPNGKLIALFYLHQRPGGPPFGANKEEILNYFGADFEPLVFQLAEDSIERRQGDEYLAIFQLKS